jgi:hypothetical protein
MQKLQGDAKEAIVGREPTKTEKSTIKTMQSLTGRMQSGTKEGVIALKQALSGGSLTQQQQMQKLQGDAKEAIVGRELTKTEKSIIKEAQSLTTKIQSKSKQESLVDKQALMTENIKNLAGGELSATGFAETIKQLGNIPAKDIINQTQFAAKEQFAETDIPKTDTQLTYGVSKGVIQALTEAQAGKSQTDKSGKTVLAEGIIKLDLEMKTPWGEAIKKQIDILVDQGRIAPGSARDAQVYSR